MFVRYTIEIFGNFNPNIMIPLLDLDNFNITDYSDCKNDNFDDYSIILINNKKEFSVYYDKEYEKSFVEFFERNYKVLKEYGADDLRIFLEAYYSDQCNFSIFDEFLPILAKYNISLPISVYYVAPENNKIENLT